jgi:hypothetical protein
LPYPILLTVGNEVGGDEPAELLEDVRRKRINAAGLLGLGNESEQPLRISGGQRNHGSSKDMTNDE